MDRSFGKAFTINSSIMVKKLLQTEPQWISLILRLTLLITFLPHGIQKMRDYGGMIDILHSAYSLPTIIAALVPLIEFFAPILLLIGLGTRPAAALIIIIMLGAIPYHLDHGFFMNWFGSQGGEGYQFHVLAIGAAAALFMLGGGKYSLDDRITNS